MKFFDLKDYYTTNFNLINSGKWSLMDLDCMFFWEREIYVNLLVQHNEKLKEKQREFEMNYGRR
jgi:hypothetical protein